MLAASTAKEAGCVFAARKITETPREACSNQPPQQSNALSGCGHLNSRNPNNSAETPEATERLTSQARVWTIFFCGSETVSNFGLLFYFDKRLVKAIEVWDFFERSRHSNVYRSWQINGARYYQSYLAAAFTLGDRRRPFLQLLRQNGFEEAHSLRNFRL
jgi:hypothetical protein